MTYAKFCNKTNINLYLTNETDIHTEIKIIIYLNYHIQKTYRNATQIISAHNINPIIDPFLSERNHKKQE